MADRSAAQKLGTATALLVGTVFLSRVLGFARDAYIAWAFGADGRTDAFYAAFTIPDMLNYLVAGGTLSITFIPIYTRHLAAGTEPDGNRVFSIIATTMGLAVAASVVALEWLAPDLLALYLHGLRPESLSLAVTLTRILLPAQLFFYLGGLAAATLFARHRFIAVAWAPLVYNLGTILGGLLLKPALGVASLAWGTLAGALVGPFVIQLFAARRAGLRYRARIDLGDREFHKWLGRSIPLMLGVSLVTADEWILRYFAASDLGAISCMSYAKKLVMVPIALAGQAAGQASMPFLARLFAQEERVELGKLVTRTVRTSGALAALAGAGIAALATPVVELLFERGRFGPEQVGPTALYVVVFALAIPLWAMQAMVARAFYATGDTLTPMLSGTIVTLVSLPVYAVGVRALGIPGLALASDVGILLHMAVLLWLLPRRVAGTNRAAILGGVLRAVALGALGALGAWPLARGLSGASLGVHARAAAQLAAGGALYVGVVVLLLRRFRVQDGVSIVDKVLARAARKSSPSG